MARHDEFHEPMFTGLGKGLHVPFENRLEGLLGPSIPDVWRQRLTRSSANASWTYIGCSSHKVPSLSNTAMRSAGTK